MNIVKKLVSAYLCQYPKRLTYLWQGSDYRSGAFIKWWWRVSDFRTVAHRGDVVATKASRVVHGVTLLSLGTYLLLSLLSIFLVRHSGVAFSLVVFVSIVLLPASVALFTMPVVWLLRAVYQTPKEQRLTKRAHDIFAKHPGVVIAVAGSYGKTTMKELLAAVLARERKVAYTEGNRNVLTSIAQFATTLDGDEDIVIVEFGEGWRGDVERMTAVVQPDYAVLTGLASNHLDEYGSIEALSADFMTLAHHVGPERLFFADDTRAMQEAFSSHGIGYGRHGVAERRVESINVEVNRLTFQLVGCGKKIDVVSGLVGEHNVGPLTLAVHIAHIFGGSTAHIEAALRGTKPYEHRLEPRPLHGAWLIDDTYNGNIEGVRAGLAYLKALKADGRKIYVTPGLVDQGNETKAVHLEMGRLIAECNPSDVYLMRNSVTDLIVEGLSAQPHTAAVRFVDDPLGFYNSLETIVAKGDVVLCQNDWPDFYT